LSDDDDELAFINERYETIFEDIKKFEALLSTLPVSSMLRVRSIFGAIMCGISSCHKDLALAAKQKIEILTSDLNYLVFDLEATRRERDEYKRKLGL